MSTKLILEYDYDFDLFGLISSVKAYKMAWVINSVLNIDLESKEELVFTFPKSGNMNIGYFSYETDYSSLRLYKNKSVGFEEVSKPFLVPELKEYDYLFVYEGESDTFTSEEIKERLNEHKLVHYIKPIEVDSLPSKENLIC